MARPQRILAVEGDVQNVRMAFTGVDISGYVGWDMHVRREDGSRFTRAGVFVEVQPSAPPTPVKTIIDFPFLAGDLTAGDHRLEFELEPAASAKFTLPAELGIDLIVRRQLG